MAPPGKGTNQGSREREGENRCPPEARDAALRPPAAWPAGTLIVYEATAACGGWKVAVYERGGLGDFQLHNPDDGKVWESEADAEARAAGLRLLPAVGSYRVETGLCCLPCRYHHPFSDFGRTALCCLGCGQPACLNRPGEHAAAQRLDQLRKEEMYD